MVSRDIIQRLLAIINDTRARLNTLESREVSLLTATQTLTNKTLTTPTIGNFTNAQHAHTGATSGGTISHGSLTDLTTGDPHTQYLLESVYDANTILKADADNTPIALTVGASTIVGRAATGNIAALTAAQVATIVQSSIDHGSIAGLTDDDHTGYARLAGRSGGQTLIGGTAANDDLTLEGTSSATRTTSYVVLQPNGGNVGIGTASPTDKLNIVTTAAYGGLTLESTLASNYQTALNFKGSTGATFGRLGYDQDTDSIKIMNFSTWLGPGGTGESGADILFYTNNDTTTPKMAIGRAGNVGIGTTSPSTRLDIDAGAIEFAEMTAPAAGAVNTGRLFCRDNGSGKTQLCIIFSGGGAIQVIATQP